MHRLERRALGQRRNDDVWHVQARKYQAAEMVAPATGGDQREGFDGARGIAKAHHMGRAARLQGREAAIDHWVGAGELDDRTGNLDGALISLGAQFSKASALRAEVECLAEQLWRYVARVDLDPFRCAGPGRGAWEDSI
jgi:hypothetical protein